MYIRYACERSSLGYNRPRIGKAEVRMNGVIVLRVFHQEIIALFEYWLPPKRATLLPLHHSIRDEAVNKIVWSVSTDLLWSLDSWVNQIIAGHVCSQKTLILTGDLHPSPAGYAQPRFLPLLNQRRCSQ